MFSFLSLSQHNVHFYKVSILKFKPPTDINISFINKITPALSESNVYMNEDGSLPIVYYYSHSTTMLMLNRVKMNQ